MTVLVVCFFAGWLAGVLFEYTYHWYMHKVPLMFHIEHHHDFFKFPPNEVAVRARNLWFDFKYAVILLASLLPLTYFWGFAPVLTFFAAVFFHLVILYESSHSILHYDSWLPNFLTQSRLYKWWKGCHYAHHHHSPTGNYCVTFPVMDWFLGSYISPIPSDLKLPPGSKETPQVPSGVESN